MPTGYTEKVQKGEITELKDFALQCARAFGACIMQRDDDPNELPKLLSTDSYHLNVLQELQKRKTNLSKRSRKRFIQQEKNNTKRYIRENLEMIAEQANDEIRYKNILQQVENWQPPTNDHNELKKFMIQQLEDSIEWDCNNSYNMAALKEYNALTDEDYNDMYDKRMEEVNKKIDYHMIQHSNQIKNIEEKNRWITELYKSFGLEIQ